MASVAESDTPARDGRVSQSKPEPQCLSTVIMSWLATSSRPCRASTSGSPSPPFRTVSPRCDRPSLARAAAPQQPEGRRLLAAGVNKRTLRPYFVVRSDLSFWPGRDQQDVRGVSVRIETFASRPRQRGLKDA